MKIPLAANEKIVFSARRHWFVFLGHVLIILLFSALPAFFFSTLAGRDLPFSSLPGDSFYLAAFAYALWLLFLWIALFVGWTNYYLDILILTDKKVIDIEQKSLFHREVSSFPLEKVQDVTVNVRGIIATFLKFGDVHVQTAGESRDFILRAAKNPFAVKEKILEAQRKILEKAETAGD